MANDCGAMDMSCCRTVTHMDDAVAAKSIRSPMPDVNDTPEPVAIATEMPAAVPVDASFQNHPPPPLDTGASFLILRI
jgi:hypothetical protein